MKKMSMFYGCILLNMIHATPQQELNELYHYYCKQPSDINEHIPTLRDLAKECDSVLEMGLRDMNSTWGVIKGLSESSNESKKYYGIDLANPPSNTLNKIADLAAAHNISFYFWKVNNITIKASDLPAVDMIFIDTCHTYCHLTYELESFACKAKKYIAMHDTDEPWGFIEDDHYFGNYSEYPAHIDRTKKGLWSAVEDFLKNHPEWVLHKKYINNHGFTILKRISPDTQC